MRKLMWFTIGFAAACGLGVWVLPADGMVLSLLTAAALTCLGWKCGPKRLAAVLLGCTVGLSWYLGYRKISLTPAYEMDGITIRTTVAAVDYSYDTDYGVGVDGEFSVDGKSHKIRLYVNGVEEICPGDTIQGAFQLRYTAPGGMRDPTYHAGDGILLLGYPRGQTELRQGTGQGHQIARLRRGIQRRLEAIFPEKTAPLAKALLLGDDFDLDYETDIAFKLSGIRHIIAVSGLHVAMLFSVLRAVSLNRRWIMALIGYPVLYLFAAVAGFTPSVSRACIMVGLMMLSQLMNREYDPPTALSFAALVMLVKNPLVITSISFQMSFACVAGIQLFHGPISAWLTAKLGTTQGRNIGAGLRRWFISSVSISLSAILLTTPISAYHFGTVSIVGVLTNLVTLWAVSLSFYGIVAALAVSLIWMKGAVIIAAAASAAMTYVTAMAKLLSALPLAAVYTASIYIVLWLMFVYLLLLIFLVSQNRHPLVLSCCAVLGLCLALLVSWTEYRFSDTHLTALDVGQGQCLILHTDGKTFLIDCGGSNDEIAANTAADTLLSRGVTHLDGIILTHGDRDHAGGIQYLLQRLDTEFIMLPATSGDGFPDQSLIWVGENLTIATDSGKITVFGPTFSPESNENSLCVLFERENCAILVTSDRSRMGELLLLREPDLPEVDLLIAGHHGSQYSTSEELLTAVSPETVFICVGKNNSYGHPAGETLERLKKFGCVVYRTDLQGNLIFRR